MNWVEIDLVVLHIGRLNFGNFILPVNNTLVCCVSFFVLLSSDA